MKLLFPSLHPIIHRLALCLLSLAGLLQNSVATPDNYADWVNPLVGTDSTPAFSTGNTYPAIARPWGMHFWTPQTNTMGHGWIYQYNARNIKGFRQTHQPSPWIGDYGAFALMPMVGKVDLKSYRRGSAYSHKSETARPYYYQVYLADHDVTTEITPTDRAAQIRFSFPQSEQSWVLVDLFNQGSGVEIDPQRRSLDGYCRNNRGGVPDNFHNYLSAVFDKPIEEIRIWKNGRLLSHSKQAKGEHIIVALRFKTRKGESVGVKLASSFISPQQARLNRQREVDNDSFEQTRDAAKKQWNQTLGRIAVEGGSPEQTRTFYTALYRTQLFPRQFHEINADKQIVHYSPYNGKVLPGYLYTDNGFWDTFRAAFPLNTLLFPELNARIMQGLAHSYQESGWLPEWASPGHRNCMIGSNSAAAIADSYLKGIRGYDINTLYQAILKNTEQEGPLDSVGRLGVQHYNRLGYIPNDAGIRENIARSLEYCYADHTIWQLAKALGRPAEEVERFRRRAQNYRHVFDPSTRFMRGKNSDGQWARPFIPEKWGGEFTEGNAWHYTWSVFHDPQGLIQLMGGKPAFNQKLDSVFTTPPHYDASYYGQRIHEILEMQVANMGQYAHGNQPVQHMIYLYNYSSQPWKCQYWVREVMDRLYTSSPDGLCGDEDNGQTSAWYVFSALGFYPVCPGSGEYVIGSPLFPKATIHLPNGKEFTIQASNNNARNRYIQQASLNQKPHSKNYIRHQQITHGGSLDFKMGQHPNQQRGIQPGDAPYSMTARPTPKTARPTSEPASP